MCSFSVSKSDVWFWRISFQRGKKKEADLTAFFYNIACHLSETTSRISARLHLRIFDNLFSWSLKTFCLGYHLLNIVRASCLLS